MTRETMTRQDYRDRTVLRCEDITITVDDYVTRTGIEDFVISACGIDLYDTRETPYDYPRQLADAYIERVYTLDDGRFEIEV